MTDAEAAARLLCKLRGWHRQNRDAWYAVDKHEEHCDDCGQQSPQTGATRVTMSDDYKDVRWPA